MDASTYEQRKTALIDEIIAAFDGVERGNGITLHQAKVLDNYGTPEQFALARLKDKEKRWQDIPERYIMRTDAVLGFLDSKGFHYYLPAYLVCYLRHMDDDMDSNSEDKQCQVLYELCDRAAGKKLHYGFHLLTPEQNRAVANFLVLLDQRIHMWIAEDDAELYDMAISD